MQNPRRTYKFILILSLSVISLIVVPRNVSAADWQEVTDKRNRTSKTYQDAENPNKFSWDGSLATIHYESTIDSGNYDSPVDMTPVRVNNAVLDGWEITQNGWHYRLGTPTDKGEDGWVGFGGRKGERWFNFRLAQVGYLEWNNKHFDDVGGAINYDRENLSTQVNNLTLGPNNEELPVESALSWKNLWTTPDGGSLGIRWRVNGDELKEEIVVDQKAREWSATNKASKTKKDETWFGFVFDIDWDDIPKVIRDGVEKSKGSDLDLVDEGKNIEFKDETDRLLAFMPISDAWVVDSNGEEISNSRTELRKRFYKQGNDTYLLVGLRSDTLDSLPDGDLIIDPTLNYQVGASAWNDHEIKDVTIPGTNGTYGYLDTYAHWGNRTSAGQYGGVRFTGVTIPVSSVISTSYLSFRAHLDTAGVTCNLRIEGNDIAAAVAPTKTADFWALTRTTNSVDWNNVDSWVGGTWYNTPSLNIIIQELVDSYNYSAGSAMQFPLANNSSSTDAYRTYRTFDSTPADAPRLHIEYSTNNTPSSPTSPTQLKNDASTTISNQGYTNETNVKLRASATDADTTETLTLFLEAVANADSFSSPATPTTGTSCASGTAYADCASKIWYVTSSSDNYSSTPYTGAVNVTGLTNTTGYKWQVKACDDTPACSSWVVYNATTSNFTIDTSAPTISSPTSSDSSEYIYTNGTTIYYGDDMSSAQSFTVSGSTSDGGSGLNQATFTSTCLGSPGADATPAAWSATYEDVSSADTCTTTITVTVSDAAGNTATQDYTISYDTTNPSVVSSPTSSSHVTSTWSIDTTIDVSWTAATDTGGSGVSG